MTAPPGPPPKPRPKPRVPFAAMTALCEVSDADGVCSEADLITTAQAHGVWPFELMEAAGLANDGTGHFRDRADAMKMRADRPARGVCVRYVPAENEAD